MRSLPCLLVISLTGCLAEAGSPLDTTEQNQGQTPTDLRLRPADQILDIGSGTQDQLAVFGTTWSGDMSFTATTTHDNGAMIRDGLGHTYYVYGLYDGATQRFVNLPTPVTMFSKGFYCPLPSGCHELGEQLTLTDITYHLTTPFPQPAAVSGTTVPTNYGPTFYTDLPGLDVRVTAHAGFFHNFSSDECEQVNLVEMSQQTGTPLTTAHPAATARFRTPFGTYVRTTCEASRLSTPENPTADYRLTLDRVDLVEAPTPVVGLAGKCLDVDNGRTSNGTRVQLWDCNHTAAQAWSRTTSNELLGPGGKCLDVKDANAAAGTPIQLYDCNGTAAQQWTWSGTGEMVGLGGRCLDVRTGATANGTQIQLWDCNGTAAQQWSRAQ